MYQHKITPESLGLPPFRTNAGNMLPAGTMDHNDTQFCFHASTEEECRTYAADLAAAGFVQQCMREIPAGSEATYFTNLFYTFLKDELQVFLFWNAAMHIQRITVMPAGAIPMSKSLLQSSKAAVEASQKEELDAADLPDVLAVENKACRQYTIKPSITQMTSEACGLSMIAQTSDGAFVMIDGGNYCPADCKRLYDFMQEKTPADRKPKVALWLFTHMHRDHMDLAAHFMQEYGEIVEVAAFAYQFQDCKTITVMENYEVSLSYRKALEESMHRFYPDAIHYTLHTGQVYYFHGMELEILWTGDDMYPCVLVDFNEASVACRMKFDSGRTVMILGDCSHEPCRNIATTYGDYLKSDVLQVAHHGLIGGDKRLYQLIDPEACFWATYESRFLGKLAGQQYQWCIGEGGLDYNSWIRDPKVRERAHYHNSVTTTIDM